MVIAEQELDYNLDSDALAPYYFEISMATVLHFDHGNEALSLE